MTEALPLRPLFFQPGAGGVPGTTQLPYRRAPTSVEFTMTDQFGFESCTVVYAGTVEDALFWLGKLGAAIRIYGPDSDVVWEGVLNAAEVQVGDERHQRTLDGMANRWRVRFTTYTGTQGVTSAVSNSQSVLRYGTKDGVESLDRTTKTAATNLATSLAAARGWPVKSPSSSIASGEMGGPVTITLTGMGWYGTLDWLLTSSTTTATAVTTTQVTTLLTAYNSTNNFFDTSAGNITASGISDTQAIAADTTYRAAIERLLNQGNGTHRFAWGVYEGRRMTVAVWAGALSNNTIYRRWIGDGSVRLTKGNAIVPPWLVRPNANVEIAELLDPAPTTVEPDAAGRYYVARTRCYVSADRIGVDLEPAQTDSLAARIARLSRGA